MALLVALATTIGAGIGAMATYLIKRRIERHRERDAIAIEQNKVKLLTDVAGLLAKFEPSVKERTEPMLADLVESSLKNLTAPKAAPQSLLAARSISHREDQEERRKRQEEEERAAKEFRERMNKLDEDRRQSEERDKQFWIDFYRKPLAVIAERLMVYAFQSAQRHVAEHNLIEFNKDRATFTFAETHWSGALDKTARGDTDNLRAKFVEAFQVLEKRLHDALANVAALQAAAKKLSEAPDVDDNGGDN